MVISYERYLDVNTDLLQKYERPELKGFWTINTNRFTNIASQLNVKGTYSPAEEYLETEKEKARFMCAHEFGVLSTIQPQYENFDFLTNAVTQARQLRHRGTLSDVNQKASMEDRSDIVLGSDVPSTTHGHLSKVKISLR